MRIELFYCDYTDHNNARVLFKWAFSWSLVPSFLFLETDKENVHPNREFGFLDKESEEVRI